MVAKVHAVRRKFGAMKHSLLVLLALSLLVATGCSTSKKCPDCPKWSVKQ